MVAARKAFVYAFLGTIILGSVFWASRSIKASWTYDRDPPKITATVKCGTAPIINVIDNKTGNNAIQCGADAAIVTFNCNDNPPAPDGSGCKTIKYINNGTSVTTTDNQEGQQTSTASATITRAAGPTYQFRDGYSIDWAGNNASGTTQPGIGSDNVLEFDVTFSPCSISLATIPPLTVGSTSAAVTATVTPLNFTLGSVRFTTSNNGVATVTTPDSSSPYQTTVTGVGAGTSNIIAIGLNSSSQTQCTSPPSPVTVTEVNSWFQVKNGDVIANGGNLNANIPSTCASCKFIIDPEPGIAIYEGSTDLTGSNVSSKGWLANTSYKGSSSSFKYSWFDKRASGATTGDCNDRSLSNGDINSLANSAEVVRYDCGGNGVTIEGGSLNNKKLTILVNGPVTINGNVNVTGSSFFGVISSGNITVGNSVTDLEGIFITDGIFKSGVGTTALNVRGSVIGWGGVAFVRDLAIGSDTNPAELIEFAPDLVMNFPQSLMDQAPDWQEVAP